MPNAILNHQTTLLATLMLEIFNTIGTPCTIENVTISHDEANEGPHCVWDPMLQFFGIRSQIQDQYTPITT